MHIIETKRTFLRKFTMNDLDDLAAIFGNPQVMKYLGIDCQPFSRDETREILESIIRLWQTKGYGRMAVISKENDKLIGTAGLRYFQGDAELFYLLDEPYWGKGLATEIAGAVLKYAFKTYDFSQIIAVTRPANAATLRVLDKLGMNFEGAKMIEDIHAFRYAISRRDFQLKELTRFSFFTQFIRADKNLKSTTQKEKSGRLNDIRIYSTDVQNSVFEVPGSERFLRSDLSSLGFQ